MTFPAADVRLVYIPVSLLAIRCHLNASLKSSSQGTIRNCAQLQKLTGIGLQNSRHGTSAAQVSRPGLIRNLKKITLLQVAASVVISVKIFAIFASRSFHSATSSRLKFTGRRDSSICRPETLNAGHIFAGACVHSDDIAGFYKIRALNFKSSFRLDLFCYASGCITAHCDFRFKNFQIHRGRQFDIQRLTFIEGQL